MLPTRVGVAVGESFGSLCRRLAAANGLSVRDLMQMGEARRVRGFDPEAPSRTVARLLGIDAQIVVEATRDGFEPALEARLHTTPWICPQCWTRHTVDALRGSIVYFSCLRCGTYLVRLTDDVADVVPPSLHPVDEEFQRAMIDALAARVRGRFVNAITLGSLATTRLVRDAAKVPEIRRVLTPCMRAVADCIRRREVMLPEDPQFAAFILRRAWIFAASGAVTELAGAALGPPPSYAGRVPGYFDDQSAEHLADMMRGGRTASTLDLLDVGLRIAEAIATFGLRSVDVPWDVRYARDDLLLDDDVYRWRLYVCLHLRYWLRSLELAGDVDPLDRRVIDPLVIRSSRIVARRAEAASIFLGHVVQLAEELASRRSAARRMSGLVPDLDESTLRRLAPQFVMRTRSRAVRVARQWMWLDLVAGQDAYGYLKPCAPQEVRSFVELVGVNERMTLRRRCRRAVERPVGPSGGEPRDGLP